MEQSEWMGWKGDPITIRVMEHLRKVREEFKESWANGDFTADTADKTLQLNARALGVVEICTDILDLKWEDFQQEGEQDETMVE